RQQKARRTALKTNNFRSHGCVLLLFIVPEGVFSWFCCANYSGDRRPIYCTNVGSRRQKRFRSLYFRAESVTSVTETICCQEGFDAVEPGRRSAAKLAGAADRGEYCQAAGAVALGLIALPLDERMTAAALSGVPPMEKHELGKIDFELIDDAFKALLQ